MTDFTESEIQEFRTLKNDLRAIKNHFKSQKFALIEKFSKDIFLSELKDNNEIKRIEQELAVQKEKLRKEKSAQENDEIEELSKKLYERDCKRKENQILYENELKENERLKAIYNNLLAQKLNDKSRENENVKNNLLSIENKINELEKVDSMEEIEFNALEDVINEKKQILNNYKREKNDDENELHQIFLMDKKRLEILEHVFGYKILYLESVEHGFRIFFELENISLWIYVINNKFSDVKIVKCNYNQLEIKDAIEYGLQENNPVYLINYLVNKK